MSQLYIPKRIKVGYVNREDTYTKKLAYVIYYDDKGVLHKEKSWEGWRDKSIEPQEFDNKPQSGLSLNKDIKRYNWSHFSSHRTMIRVYDPRGIEFEITTENLIGVLMNSDCSKRGLSGEYVFAYSGKDLVLLPTTSEEYEKAVNYTALQSSKILTKDLVPGCSYKTKKQEDVIYVGKFMWYEFSWYKSNQPSRKGKKMHIFTSGGKHKTDGYNFTTKSNLEFLAQKNSDEIVSNYADIIDDLKKNPHSADIVKFELVPTNFIPAAQKEPNNYFYMSGKTYHVDCGNGVITTVSIHPDSRYHQTKNADNNYTGHYKLNGYTYYYGQKFDTNTKSVVKEDNSNRSYYHRSQVITQKQIEDLNLCDLYITLDNGNRVKTNLTDIN